MHRSRPLLITIVLSVGPIFAQTSFKPGDQIVLTVTFEKPLVEGATVALHNCTTPTTEKDQQSAFSNTLGFGPTASKDNKIFNLTTTVSEQTASGKYTCPLLTVRKLGLLETQVPIPNFPEIIVNNPNKDPQHVEVPKFTITGPK